MLIRAASFIGRIPKVHPRLLPENAAQVARNMRLDDGTLSPIRGMSVEHSFGADVTSIYRHNSTWLGWEGSVDVAPGPVAQDRLYYTGDGVPKMRTSTGDVYPLALAAPVNGPALTALSAVDPDLQETVLYCYTNVTGFGEESAPSATSSVLWSPGVDVRVETFDAAPTGRNVTHRRIYRSQTSALGVTDLYFVAELAIGVTSYDHDLDAAPMNEVLPSYDYDPPGDTMRGIVALPNGIMAAFDGKELFFCEPWLPHAWPRKYALRTDADIVGLAVFGSTIAVLTTRNPYLVQGTHPDSMVMERVDANMPCLSKRGIVDLGYAAVYPSHDGLALIGAGRSEIISKSIFTRRQWHSMSPESIVAAGFDGRYMLTYIADQFDVIDAGDHSTENVDEFGNGDHTGFPAGALSYDFGSFDSAFGTQRVGSIDISSGQPFFNDFDIAAPTSMYFDPATGNLYMLTDAMDVSLWDDEDEPTETMRWKSRLYHMSFPTSFGAVMVQTDDSVTAPDFISCTVFADGVAVGTATEPNKPARLSGGALANRWEIEIEGNVPATGILLAGTIEELIAT